MPEFLKFSAVLLAVAGLTGCGGGGGGGSADASAATAAAGSASATTTAGGNSSAGAATSITTIDIGADTAVASAPPLDTNAAAGDAPAAPMAELSFANEALVSASGTGSDGLLQTGLATASAVSATPVLTVRARADLAAGIGAMMTLRIDGVTIASVEVKATSLTDYSFNTPTLKAGSKVDLVFTNDATVSGQDRNLYIGYLGSGSTVVLPSASNSTVDRGTGAAALDGKDTLAGQGGLYWNAALRLTWPASAAVDAVAQTSYGGVVRFLQQASFGPTPAEITRVAAITPATWISQQMALPATPDFVNAVQAKYALGDAWRPGGAQYDPVVVGHQFWASAATSSDQLRKRVGFALHQIFMVSQTDSNLYNEARAYASYLDALNRNAFGNYRTLLEDVALSPATGIYLSHMRNRKEDAASGRLPDENFAREVMQLFSIGLVELNNDGTTKLGSNGKPIETYSNADVMAMAKVFTGWSWAYPDAQLTEQNFRWGTPDKSVAKDSGIDLLRMKAYPGQHSTAEKRLFSGKSNAVVIPANGSASEDLRLALDALFRHPNVGPFVSRQLIQRLVTGNPTPAFVGRVATVFNNNGKGVRGDLAAVVRAILLDADARTTTPAADFGKLREPILRVALWLRAFGATSKSGDFKMGWELDPLSQRAFAAPSVFSYFRPGYVPPNTSFSASAATAPEFQLVNESTVAAWVNTVEAMTGSGLGWNGSANDVSSSFAPQVALATAGNLGGLVDNLNLLLFAGRMSAPVRQAILDGVAGVSGSDAASQLNRARIAAFLAMSCNDFVVQR